jgi:Na+(H+)/acetate symporter ActP
MKFVVIFALLALSGVFLFIYTINSCDLLDWQALDEVLANKEIITQEETKDLVIDYYRRGLLPQYLKKENVIQLMLAVFMIVFGIVGCVHLLIDKLLFRKFYEEPGVWAALRRAILWAILPAGIFYLAIYNLLEFSLIVLFVLILICLEIVLSTIVPSKKKIKAKTKSEKSE